MESNYSIKDLEHLTGIKAHTIRAWESRYDLIEPRRTSTNIRYYVDQDLKHILNISVLVKGGMRISNVAKLNPEQIRSAVIDAGQYQGNYDSQINALKIAMVDFDEYLFDSVFNKCLIQFGTDETLTKVLAPFIYEIGTLWQAGAISVCNEHFISGLVKQKMFAIIDQILLTPTRKTTKSFVLYLPGDELHELGLLYLYYFLKKRGHRVIYLGQSVPMEYLKEVTEKTEIDQFVSIFTSAPHHDEMDRYFEQLSGMFDPNTFRFFFTGYQVNQAEVSNIPPHVSLMPNLQELAASIG